MTASCSACTTAPSANGLRTTEVTPASIASSTSAPDIPVRATIGTSRSARISRVASTPPSRGRPRSSRITSGSCSRASSIASTPSRASGQTSKPAVSSTRRRSARTIGSSSTVRTLVGAAARDMGHPPWVVGVGRPRQRKKAPSAIARSLEAGPERLRRHPVTQVDPSSRSRPSLEVNRSWNSAS